MKIITKEFNSFNIRILLIDGVEWFVAKDVAELLLYKRPADAVFQHCKNSIDFEIGKIPNANFSKKARLIKLIPEPDVWRLIIKSKLPEAQKIEKWIFEEVLPSIRKTGSYSLTKESLPKTRDDLISISDQELDRELKALDFILSRMNFSEKDKINFVNQTLERINFPLLHNPHLRKLQPVFTVTKLLKEFNVDIRPADFNKRLESFGVIERSENGWQLIDMQFGENRKFSNSISPRYYRGEFQKLLEIVL